LSNGKPITRQFLIKQKIWIYKISQIKKFRNVSKGKTGIFKLTHNINKIQYNTNTIDESYHQKSMQHAETDFDQIR
jgi:hypothetical protein